MRRSMKITRYSIQRPSQEPTAYINSSQQIWELNKYKFHGVSCMHNRGMSSISSCFLFAVQSNAFELAMLRHVYLYAYIEQNLAFFENPYFISSKILLFVVFSWYVFIELLRATGSYSSLYIQFERVMQVKFMDTLFSSTLHFHDRNYVQEVEKNYWENIFGPSFHPSYTKDVFRGKFTWK